MDEARLVVFARHGNTFHHRAARRGEDFARAEAGAEIGDVGCRLEVNTGTADADRCRWREKRTSHAARERRAERAADEPQEIDDGLARL